MCCLLPLWPLIPASWPVEKTISGIGLRRGLEDRRAGSAERAAEAGQAGVVRARTSGRSHRHMPTTSHPVSTPRHQAASPPTTLIVPESPTLQGCS